MAFTQTDIDTLEDAIRARGFVRSMTFSDQSVTFDSIDDMFKLLAHMKDELAVSVAGSSRTRYAAFDKGV